MIRIRCAVGSPPLSLQPQRLESLRPPRSAAGHDGLPEGPRRRPVADRRPPERGRPREDGPSGAPGTAVRQTLFLFPGAPPIPSTPIPGPREPPLPRNRWRPTPSGAGSTTPSRASTSSSSTPSCGAPPSPLFFPGKKQALPSAPCPLPPCASRGCRREEPRPGPPAGSCSSGPKGWCSSCRPGVRTSVLIAGSRGPTAGS